LATLYKARVISRLHARLMVVLFRLVKFQLAGIVNCTKSHRQTTLHASPPQDNHCNCRTQNVTVIFIATTA